MSKRLGEYVPLSATYADDDAILCLTPLAELLYIRSLALASKLHSDGYLTEAQVLHRAGLRLGSDQKVKKLVSELVTGGLWERESGGYFIRGWLKWNRSSEDLGRERAKDRDRKRAQRHEEAGEEPFIQPGEAPYVQPDSATCPPGHMAESEGTDDGIQTDSERIPGGVQPESGIRPASRAPARGGARRAVSTNDRSYDNGTARNGTLPEMPEDPPESPSARANRLARFYTDQVPISNFPAIAKIVRKAVDANVSDDRIIGGLKKVIADNQSLTTETLRVAIYGKPRGESPTEDRARQALDAGAEAAAILAARGEK